MPVPITPRANSVKAKSPAMGLSASAACAVVWISVMPLAFRVMAVASITQNAMRLENTMPMEVSSLMRERCSRMKAGLATKLSLPTLFWRSSDSCEACQKIR